MIALLIAVIWLRTPRQFEFWESMHQQFADFFARHESLPDFIYVNNRCIGLNRAFCPACRDATEEDMKRAWDDWLRQAAGIAEIFLKMRWVILVSERSVFITSDNLVLAGDALGPHRGFTHPDAMVTFPLSPTRVLMMDNRHNEPDAQFYQLKHDSAAANVLI